MEIKILLAALRELFLRQEIEISDSQLLAASRRMCLFLDITKFMFLKFTLSHKGHKLVDLPGFAFSKAFVFIKLLFKYCVAQLLNSLNSIGHELPTMPEKLTWEAGFSKECGLCHIDFWDIDTLVEGMSGVLAV